MQHIDILLATYNGEKYLEAQILSLQQQTHKNWTLWIKDDCSTDSTKKIIQKFCNDDARIIKIDSTGINIGAAKNFFSLLQYANSEYIIFCDQDDIWFEKKLEILLKQAEKYLENNLPGLVYCDAHAYSNVTGVITSQGIQRFNADSLKQFLFLNSGYQGSSTLFNKKLLSYAQNYKREFFMHDDIIALIAHTFGKVHFISRSLMLYRQHEDNVTGNIVLNRFDIVKRFFKRDACVLNKLHYEETIQFYEEYHKLMEPKQVKLFQEYITYPESSFLKRLMIIVRNDFSLGKSRFSLIVKTFLRKPVS
ncbi:MAG: glycosyltransferase [Sulfurovum sp.]|nr:glycosyltransferase [Sulfurovum sp.]